MTLHAPSLSGAQYLNNGLTLVFKPGIRRYVVIPLFINIVLLSIATIAAFSYIGDWYDSLHGSEYEFIRWMAVNLDWLLWPLIVLSVLIVVFFLFAFLANWIAAPFNGLLAEAVENYLIENSPLDGSLAKLTGHSSSRLNSETNRHSLATSMLAELPRLLAREWRKLVYYLPRALACLILFFIPPLTMIAPFVWFIFNAWMAAIQYIDYPMDNHKVSFSEMLLAIRENRAKSMSFGLIVMFLTMIPIVNIFLMPVAVAGATNLWFDHIRVANRRYQ